MPAKNYSRSEDIVALELLDLADRQGLRGAELRRRMAEITRNSWSNGRVQGLLSRLRLEPEPRAGARPENRDGGMPARWWAA
ncbi:hypothetical protein [uncultured Roseovarius sp.]|uniref:hypothetical protein n=1 Tax=uncultured Roseovarius sp. TaxID=293344 RepID=UPI000C44603F|nr:hypothetical protein [Roseovarius sp.]MBD11593.1 hypothetical protein [Roseovarius sp.]|tara:strand:- start:666 stop:911 length:246 start_codon:yes stop_codon:yes gene_type:complete